MISSRLYAIENERHQVLDIHLSASDYEAHRHALGVLERHGLSTGWVRDQFTDHEFAVFADELL